MKMLSRIMFIILSIIVVGALLIVSIPRFMPNLMVSWSIPHTDIKSEFNNTLVVSLSSEDKSIMDDIYIKSSLSSNNEVKETYHKLNISMGGQDFEWEKFFKFNNLKINTPFDGRSIEFKDVNNYNLMKPDTEQLPILYSVLKNNVSKINISNNNLARAMGNDSNYGFRYEFETDGDSATAIMKEFLEGIKNSSSFDEFFTENGLIEAALLLDDGTSGLKDILNMLIENSMAGKLTIKCDVYNLKVKNITMDVSFDYVVNKQLIPMNLYVTQEITNIHIDDLYSLIRVSSLTDIEDLRPDTDIEDKYGKYEATDTMVENPLESGSKVPGIILSDEYQRIAGGGSSG